MQASVTIAALLLTITLITINATAGIPPGMAKAVFVVHCYDVGVSALAGKPGVVTVEPGWSGAREVDRVIFNPQDVSVTQLEHWLRQADTYVRTLEISLSDTPAKEMSQ